MEFDLLYWHWIVLGIALVLTEIFIGSFFVFWFGVAAVVVGIVMLVFPAMPITAQILLWSLLSALLAVAWFKYLKPLSPDRTTAGLSREALLGEIGQVLRAPNGDKRGKLRFSVPIMGSDEWLIISQDALIVGDRVSVMDVSGNSLIVKKA